MADVISNAMSSITTAATQSSTSSGGSGWIIGIGAFLGLAIVSIAAAFIWWHFHSKKKWNIITRVHYENPTINGVSLGGAVLTKRVRFKDGRVVYLYKNPIQGYTISPELLTWTRPREHDIIVTQDKKVFCLNGINSIDVQRKMLNVDISYPDIEMDRQDLQKHIDSKKYDDPNERFKIIARIALYIFLILGIIALSIIGGHYYLKGKNIDLARDNINLQVSGDSIKIMDSVNTFIAILSKVMPESFKAIDNRQLIINETLT